MKTRPKVLFISHSASRNGASILLLQFLEWLKGRVDWDIEVLIDGQGPLLDAFGSLGRTRVLRNAVRPLSLLPERWRAILEPYLQDVYIRALLAGRRFDLIYANTAATWPQVRALREKTDALLWHIHEMEYALRLQVPDDTARELFDEEIAFVAVSHSVRDVLIRQYHVPSKNVELIHGFVPVPKRDGALQAATRRRITDQIGWPGDVFVVGGCGALGWRKGSDLFLRIAQRVALTPGYESVRFLWVGGDAHSRDALEFEHDLNALGLRDRCVRVPVTADVADYYCAMDVLALTSREDPFPLVMLEAGAHRLPIVCFAASGGAAEFIETDAGLIAPSLDVDAFAEHLFGLHDDGNLREALGARACSKVHSRYSVAVQAPKVLEAIRRRLRSGAGAQEQPCC